MQPESKIAAAARIDPEKRRGSERFAFRPMTPDAAEIHFETEITRLATTVRYGSKAVVDQFSTWAADFGQKRLPGFRLDLYSALREEMKRNARALAVSHSLSDVARFAQWSEDARG